MTKDEPIKYSLPCVAVCTRTTNCKRSVKALVYVTHFHFFSFTLFHKETFLDSFPSDAEPRLSACLMLPEVKGPFLICVKWPFKIESLFRETNHE